MFVHQTAVGIGGNGGGVEVFGDQLRNCDFPGHRRPNYQHVVAHDGKSANPSGSSRECEISGEGAAI